MSSISASVGNGGANKTNEVKIIQTLINGHFSRVRTISRLPEDGIPSPALYQAIRIFQYSMGIKSPDGLVSPGGRTLKSLQTKPEVYRLEGKKLQGHKEDSVENKRKRASIQKIAVGYNGSVLWAFATKKGDFPANSNKCNKFVYDVLQEAGINAYVSIRGQRRPPLAAEWADKNTEIPNWRVLTSFEPRQAGDVAAYSLTGGGTSFSGHTGFIVQISSSLSNISAHDDAVYPTPNQFEHEPTVAYRRYIGE
ncbi:CHAP domain-containing protein [Delftia acidovorans]|uniref:CHAP domain-containing protein n=1 Tax=Delftia acidovorans TaxID=80866 RepID=UPI001EFDD691|nr:CHAP domain-containing protein [Delftia acidovorans]MCG8985485.1 CHAP domain-containing protein [Delftia acidovorans]